MLLVHSGAEAGAGGGSEAARAPSLPARSSCHAAMTELWFVPRESEKRIWQQKREAQSAEGNWEVLPERTQLEGFCIDFSRK